MNQPSLFDAPGGDTDAEGHPAARLAQWAWTAVRTDDAQRLRQLAIRCAEIRLEFDGGFEAYELALDLAKVGLIDGTESRDGWGSVGFELPALASREYRRVPAVLAAAYRVHPDGTPVEPERIAVMERILARSHQNRSTRWVALSPDQRAVRDERLRRSRRRARRVA